MRRATAFMTLMVGWAVFPTSASAQQSSVSGAVGGGIVGDRAVALFDVGLDVAGDSYALGLGGRLRVAATGGVRDQEWDEPSEFARMVRYLTYERDDADGPRASFVAGELGDADLGEGTVIDGYSSGLDIDHGHLGAHLRVRHGRWALDAITDDLVSPRIAGLRGGIRIVGGLVVGSSVSVDLTAPAMAGSGVLPIVSTFVGRDWLADRLHTYAEAVAVSDIAAGLHVGVRLAVPLAMRRLTVHVRGEARLGSDSYIPGWIGPLYELTRWSRVDRARQGGLGGPSGMFEAGVDVPDLGRLDVSVRQRRGLPELFSARAIVPHARGVQAALTATFEDLDGADPRRFVVAAELRARLPARMYVSVEATHLYRAADSMAEPVWLASAAVGGILGAE